MPFRDSFICSQAFLIIGGAILESTKPNATLTKRGTCQRRIKKLGMLGANNFVTITLNAIEKIKKPNPIFNKKNLAKGRIISTHPSLCFLLSFGANNSIIFESPFFNNRLPSVMIIK